MGESLQRLRSQWRNSRIAGLLQRTEILRFIVAGGVNTLFGYVIYSLGILLGAPVWMALLVGMLLGTVFNFFTTGGYAFRQLSKERYPRFVACYLLVYGINIVLIETLSNWISNNFLTQAILLVPLAALSYVLMARLVFVKHA